MALRIDLNEYLFLKTLSAHLHEYRTRTIPLEQYYCLLEMNEHFFKNTLLGMQKKNLVAIGFDRRGLILKVVNWPENFSISTSKLKNFSISLTKEGRTQLESW